MGKVQVMVMSLKKKIYLAPKASKEEDIILSHNFSGLSPWVASFKTETTWQNLMAEESFLLYGGNEGKEKGGTAEGGIPSCPFHPDHFLITQSPMNSSVDENIHGYRDIRSNICSLSGQRFLYGFPFNWI